MDCNCPQESHTWTIRDKQTVRRLNKGKISDAIDSDTFTMFDDFKLYLRFRPNGLSKGKYHGNTFLILYLTGLPPHRSAINFRYELSLLETKTVCTKSTTFKKGFMNISWDKGILSTRSIKHLKQFTLTITMELLAVYDNKDNDVTKLYEIIDEYQEINLQDIPSKNTKQKVMRSLSRPSILRKRSSIVASLKFNKRDSLKLNKRDSLKLNKRDSVNIITFYDKMEQLEISIRKMNIIMSDLSDRVCHLERRHKEEKEFDMFDIKKEQYALLMKEINGIKRAVDQVQKPIHPKIDYTNKHSRKKKSGMRIQRLKQWLLVHVKLPQYFEVFVEHDIIDLDILYKITSNDLREMGIYKIGHQLKIMQNVENLMTNAGGPMRCELDEHVIITDDNLLKESGSSDSDSDDLYATLIKRQHQQHGQHGQHEGDLNMKDTDTVIF